MKIQQKPIAHIDDSGSTHDLEGHLLETASLAERFAAIFGAGEWAKVAGKWHDLGKYSKKFQKKLTKDPLIRVDHSTAGAQYAVKHLPKPQGYLIAWLIAGHHTGLPDWSSADGGRSALQERLDKQIEPFEEIMSENIIDKEVELRTPKINDPALWVRMLFSALVDADFLDTEAFFDQERSSIRGSYPTIESLQKMFETYITELQAKSAQTPLNRLRSEILEICIKEGQRLGNGIYTLTVPTGGGKTLSSMAFALNHALNQNKKRIIYVIPYTSIIEQNANVYREIFEDAVVEHHSQFAPDEDENSGYLRAKLAAENWDAPIIVTTTVQFFESLFAAKPSRCRKLHNIADSVVIVDEVQTLPSSMLQPIADKINELNKNFGVTFLLCSATQPAFESFELPEIEFRGIRIEKELMPDPEALSHSLHRTSILWEDKTPKSYEEVADEVLRKSKSALIVLNTRKRAKQLYDVFLEKGATVMHLSANMCGEHRSRWIERIKKKLSDGERFVVVSTNLVEAGVDLDFPLLWREYAGLESIAQAAGRCNREGLMDRGEVRVFRLADEPIPRYLNRAVNALREIQPDLKDPLSPEAFQRYFSTFYRMAGERLDEKGIVEEELKIGRWPFRKIAERFRMIEDGYNQSVLIPYDEKASSLLSLLDEETIPRTVLRKLQRYSVNLTVKTVERLERSGEIIQKVHGIFILENTNLYDSECGFDEKRAGVWNADTLFV